MWPIRRGGSERHLARIGWALTVTLIAAGATAVGLVWLIWRLLGAPPLARTQVSLSDFLDVVKIALAIVAGIGGVVALVVAYRRQRVAERADIREDDAHLRSDRAEQRERTRLLNERFQMASQMLGDDKAAVRLAGVHAMGNLADDWDDHEARQMCIDVMCSYLRMAEQPAPPRLEETAARDPDAETETAPSEPFAQPVDHADREVRHTILRTIAAHLRLNGSVVSWQGHDFDLTGITLDIETLDLTGAEFARGQLLLTNAKFIGSRVHLVEAVFSGGTVRLDCAQFSGGRIDFGRAEFSGSEVNVYGAEFRGGRIDFDHAEFSGGHVYFGGAELRYGELSFSGAKFSGGEVSFYGAKFRGAEVNFMDAGFSSGQVGFSRATFYAGLVYFGRAEFSGSEVQFKGAEFRGEVGFAEIGFGEAMFSGGLVCFGQAEFFGGLVVFDRAKFDGGEVNFNDTRFSGSEVNFHHAEFSGGKVDFSAVVGWSVPPNGLPDEASGLRLPALDAASRPRDC